MARSLAGLTVGRLRLGLGLFFLALAVPTALLIHQTYTRLQWETFHQHQLLAEELASRIDQRLARLVAAEAARPFTDYAFLTVAGDPSANFLQRSPLSDYPPASSLPGLMGYFQVDAAGDFSTPLLPPPGTDAARYGIAAPELRQRRALALRLRQVLGENRLVQRQEHDLAAGAAPPKSAPQPSAPAEDRAAPVVAETTAPERPAQAAGQMLFDQLNRARTKSEPPTPGSLGKVDALKLEQKFQSERAAPVRRQAAPAGMTAQEAQTTRKERSVLPEPAAPGRADEEAPPVRIRTFQSEVDPFEFSLLDSGQFVLFRKVWRDGQRYVQGLLIDQQPFLRSVAEGAFRETALSQMSDLVVAYRGDILSTFGGQGGAGYSVSPGELRGTLLYQTRLSAPLSDLELLFSINRLPAGPGGTVVGVLVAVLSLVLGGGFLLLYRLGVGQIRLARQQQDFVSAVSHELKTPITSIRMYGEMLLEGWAPEPKRQEYYRFIHDESERLSRLINNVLQLARMTRNDLAVERVPVTAGELLDGVRSKVDSQVAQAGFTLDLQCDGETAAATVSVDRDYFTQIVINLVDNALKFSAGAANRTVELGCRRLRDEVRFTVRDYGPGVPKDQMRKIFRLFYRSGNELTRETVGTGIGLALVRQLAEAMGGRVDVVNLDPGAEFQVTFKAVREFRAPA